jgi:hypothetical protein
VKRKVRIVKHNRLRVNALAYYQGDTHTIHILNPEALYRRVLEHELAHSRHRGILRLSWVGQEFMSSPLGRFLVWGTFLGFIIYFTRFITWGTNYFDPIFFILIVALVITCIGYMVYWAEDIVSESQAIQKTKHPKTRKPKIAEIVTRVPQGSVTVESDIPNPETETAKRQLDQGSEDESGPAIIAEKD